jgi:hypothetical protein
LRDVGIHASSIMDHHDNREVEEGGKLQGADYMIER